MRSHEWKNSKRNRRKQKRDEAVELQRWWAYILGGDQAQLFSVLNLKVRFDFSWVALRLSSVALIELDLGLKTLLSILLGTQSPPLISSARSGAVV